MFKAVLFDLDGTLADTAPDLGDSLNLLLREENRPPLPLSVLRPYASEGVRGLLRTGFGIAPGAPTYEPLFHRFLAIYETCLCVKTRLFPGMEALLQTLEAQNIPWGIVTNKRARYTLPLIDKLGLSTRAGCIVCGDTTPAPKPSPLPILHALAQLVRHPGETLYVGDDPRDIIAGRAAGTKTGVAAFGYLGDNAPPTAWAADFLFEHPDDIHHLIFSKKE